MGLFLTTRSHQQPKREPDAQSVSALASALVLSCPLLRNAKPIKPGLHRGYIVSHGASYRAYKEVSWNVLMLVQVAAGGAPSHNHPMAKIPCCGSDSHV